MSRPLLPRMVHSARIMVVARRLNGAVYDALEALSAVGEPIVYEVTLDDPTASHTIGRLRRRGETVGAGTVMSVEAARAAHDAGAQFIVSPHFDEAIVAWAVDAGVPVVAGAMTPTEIARAWREGVTAVKIFPASIVGPAMFRELRGPMGHIPLIPTGGIRADNAQAFIAYGAVAVGVGGWLTGGDLAGIADRWFELRAAVMAADGS